MNINLFRNQFPEGFQPNNRFSFHLNFGDKGLDGRLQDAIPVGGQQAVNALREGMVCDTTRLPDRSFDVVQMTQYTITEQFPYKSDFTKLDCTFLLPLWRGRNAIAETFYTWQNIIHDSIGGYYSTRDFEWPENYYATARLYTYDRQNKTTGCYVFERLYPLAVESVPVTWSDNSEMARLSVTFAFSTWHFTAEDAPLDETDRMREPDFNKAAFDDGVKHGFSWLELTLNNLKGAAAGWIRREVWDAFGGKENHDPEPNFTPQTFEDSRLHPHSQGREQNFTEQAFDDKADRSVTPESNIIR